MDKSSSMDESSGMDSKLAGSQIFWMVLTGLTLFAILAWQVQSLGVLTELDLRVTAWLRAHLSPWLTGPMLLLTDIHNTVGILSMSVLVALMLGRRKAWRALGFLVFTIGGGMLVNVGLKLIFERARPVFEDPLVSLDTYSFPSGHAASSTLFYGALIVLFVQQRMRWPTWIIGALMVALVCLSRVYLGAHYLSDVLAGVMVGFVWINIGRLALHPQPVLSAA